MSLKTITLKLTVSYLGTAYHGWQKQPKLPTIQAVLEEALAVILRQTVNLTAAGRTDAGVHALGQVASFSIPFQSLVAKQVLYSINGVLPNDIRVKKVEKVAEGFHARRQAISRTYKYYILNQEFSSPFLANFSWWFPKPLDIDLMRSAVSCLVGIHDFSAFSAMGGSYDSTVREVFHVGIERQEMLSGQLICFRISSNAFLYHMVRLIVGSLVEVGLGKKPVNWLAEILQSKSNKNCGQIAPARGLILERVDY
jgi:tRNA pseudouridine38-40 synthase